MISNTDFKTIEDLQETIKESLDDILKLDPGARHTFDKDVVIRETFNFVFKERPSITHANRYEWYYIFLGKAVSIVQGWKMNCSQHLKSFDDTYESIVTYIEQTYGTHRESYVQV